MNRRKFFIIGIIIVTALFALTSCSKDDIEQECDCTKKTYEIESYTYFENGLVHLGTRYNLLTTEPVGCLEETDGKENIGNGLYIEINCN